MIHLTEIYCYASSQTKSSNSTSKPKERRKTMTNDVKHNGTQSISTKWFTFNLNYHYECSFVSIYFLFRLQRADDTFFRAFTRSWRNQKSKSSTRSIISSVKIYIWRCALDWSTSWCQIHCPQNFMHRFQSQRTSVESDRQSNIESASSSGPIEFQFSSSRQILSLKHCEGFTLRLVTLMFFILYPIFT